MIVCTHTCVASRRVVIRVRLAIAFVRLSWRCSRCWGRQPFKSTPIATHSPQYNLAAVFCSSTASSTAILILLSRNRSSPIFCCAQRYSIGTMTGTASYEPFNNCRSTSTIDLHKHTIVPSTPYYRTVALIDFASKSLPVKVHLKKKSGGRKTRR
jgi:hypothetical protein